MTGFNIRGIVGGVTVGALAFAGLAAAQDNASSNDGWRRVGDQQTQAQAAYPPSNYQQSGGYQQPQPNYQPQTNYQQPQQQAPYAAQQVPAQITVPAGTYLTVHINQQLSSDHNQPGDAFSASLARPLVANGVVLAEPGQTLGGRVAQAQKAGHVEGLAKLGLELTDITMVDGQQMPLRTTLVSRTGNSSVGRDAGAIATTTGVGAAIGAAADWGRGAAIGAGAGAAAGIIGVLVTRGQPSVIYPEQVLTFRLEQPLVVSTSQSPQAFRYVQPNEYNQPNYNQYSYNPVPVPAPVYAYPAPYAYGYPYYRPYYYGSGLSLYFGSGWGRGGYWGPGYRGDFGYRGFRR